MGFQFSGRNISAEIVINLVILVACATRNKNHTRRDQDHQKHTSWPVIDYLYKMIQYQLLQWWLIQWRYIFLLANEGTSYTNKWEVPSTQTSVYQFEIQSQAAQEQNQVPVSQNWHMHRRKYYASKHLQVSIQWSRLCQDCTKWFSVGNIYQQEGQDFGILQLIYYTSRYKKYCRSDIFEASNEGSILISCATSLALGLVKPHEKLGHPPPEGNVFSSSADKIKDESQLNVHMLVRKTKLKSSNEEAPIVCSKDELSNNTTCTRNNGDKNCQAVKSDMWSVKPAMDIQSNISAMPIQYKMPKKQIVPQEDDKNCQQIINVRPVKS